MNLEEKALNNMKGILQEWIHNEDLCTNNLVSTLVKYKFKTLFVDMGDNSKVNKIGPMNR